MPSTKTYAISAALLVAAGLGTGAWLVTSNDDPFAECGAGITTGAAAIGGPFTLISETGAEVTSAEVIDGPTMVYFGYTFCPDVCPVDAAAMAQTATLLSDQGHKVKTVFITIDPARDTAKVLDDFTNNLSADMIGLTGSDEQIAAAAKAYKVYYAKPPSDDPDYYLMDHSAFTYLMTAKDRFLTIFRHGDTPDAMAKSAACYLDALEDGA